MWSEFSVLLAQPSIFVFCFRLGRFVKKLVYFCALRLKLMQIEAIRELRKISVSVSQQRMSKVSIKINSTSLSPPPIKFMESVDPLTTQRFPMVLFFDNHFLWINTKVLWKRHHHQYIKKFERERAPFWPWPDFTNLCLSFSEMV